jgi:ABC-2 type transport system ATP-binding protein
MSSHMFEEVETFKIEFLKASDFESMRKEVFTLNELRPENNQIILDIDDAQINELLLALSKRRIKFISEVRHDLEEYFMGFYNGGEIDDQ